MTQAQGETAVTTAALVTSGLYFYRKTTEKITKAPSVTAGGIYANAKGVLGVGELLPLGTWLTGAGLTFIALSIATSVNPTFGGSFAILEAVGATLGNGQAVLKDLGVGLGTKAGAEAAEGKKVIGSVSGSSKEPASGVSGSAKAPGPNPSNYPVGAGGGLAYTG